MQLWQTGRNPAAAALLPCHAWPGLQALHLEDNSFEELPAGPYLARLEELVLDWGCALGSPAALRSASHLSRLVLQQFRHNLPDLGLAVALALPDEAGGALLEALAAMPALRLVEDVFQRGAVHLVPLPVATVMWGLGRRCPHVRLGMVPLSEVGWVLSSLLPELPHNVGLAVHGLQ